MNTAKPNTRKFAIKNKMKSARPHGPASSVEREYIKANGGQMLAEGGMTEGPPHEEGGVDVYAQGQEQPVAEIEGGERVFSKEDTKLMEDACAKILELQSSNKQAADQMATQLGYAVCEMLQQQESSQSQQEQGANSAEPSQEEVAAMNEM